jgi:hypothetical protein
VYLALGAAAERLSILARGSEDDALGPHGRGADEGSRVAGGDDEHGGRLAARGGDDLIELVGGEDLGARVLRQAQALRGPVRGREEETPLARGRADPGRQPPQLLVSGLRHGRRDLGPVGAEGRHHLHPAALEESGEITGGIVEDRGRVVAGEEDRLPLDLGGAGGRRNTQA